MASQNRFRGEKSIFKITAHKIAICTRIDFLSHPYLVPTENPPVELGESSEEQSEQSVETTCTVDKPDTNSVDPEKRRSERQRKPAERLTYSRLGEPSAESVVVNQIIVNRVNSATLHFPEHYNTCHVWWCNIFAQCKSCVTTRSVILPTIIPFITL